MKKSVKKNFDLKTGISYLRFSFVIIWILVIIFLLILLMMGLNLFELKLIILRKPNLNDFAIIFAGAVLFIIVPFIIGGKFKKLF